MKAGKRRSLEIEANEVTNFCENEVANLIFSAFAGRAHRHGIPIEIKAVVPKAVSASESALCAAVQYHGKCITCLSETERKRPGQQNGGERKF